MFGQLHSKISVFLWSGAISYVFRLCPLPFVLGATEQNLALSSSFSYTRHSTHWWVSPKIFFSSLNCPRSLNLFSEVPVPSSLSWPFAGLTPAPLGSPELGPALQLLNPAVLENPFPQPAAHAVSNAAREAVDCLWSQRHISESWSAQCPWGSPDPSLQCCFQACSPLSWCLGLFLTGCKTAFPLVESYDIPPVPVLQPVLIPLNGGTDPTVTVTACSSFVSSANLQGVHFLQTPS